MTNHTTYKNYIDKGKCEPRYQAMSLCHTYFFKEFNLYPSKLHIRDEYLKTIKEKNFHDPILTYVALYLYHNYKIAQEYFKNGKNIINKSYGHHYNTACAVLNRWLDQEKNFYTNFGRCYYNLRWWNTFIEPLWETLNGYFSNKKCERYDSYYYKEATSNSSYVKDRCYQLMSENYTCYKEDSANETKQVNDDEESIKENCAKLSILFYLGEKYNLLDNNSENIQNNDKKYCTTPYKIINYNPVLKAEKSFVCEPLLSKIALPIISTVLGTILLAFFLNEFTPLGSKLKTPSKNIVRLREQFNEEAEYKEYKTHRNNNRNTAREKSIIYYQSLNE